MAKQNASTWRLLPCKLDSAACARLFESSTTLPQSAPAKLRYSCTSDSNMYVYVYMRDDDCFYYLKSSLVPLMEDALKSRN